MESTGAAYGADTIGRGVETRAGVGTCDAQTKVSDASDDTVLELLLLLALAPTSAAPSESATDPQPT